MSDSELQWLTDVDLSEANTLRLPCRVDHQALAAGDGAVLAALVRAAREGIPLWVLGEGSNVVLPRRLEGVVLSVTDSRLRLVGEDAENAVIRVGAAANWDHLVRWCAAQGWWGIENLALIPGSVGAAPIQNIGAYGQELADVCVRVRAVERSTGRVMELDAAACAFDYRDSRFRRAPDDWVVLELDLAVHKQGAPRLDYPGVREMLAEQGVRGSSPMEMVEAISSLRRRKLPDPARLPNAGSFFKNPRLSATRYAQLRAQFPDMPGRKEAAGIKVPAAWLIERCGWRGRHREAVGVADGHALVLVHYGRGDATQLLALAADIAAAVRERFGIELEREPVVLPSPP